MHHMLAKIIESKYVIIDSPKKRVKLDEEEDELAKELKDYKNSETHKQQTIIYFHLFQLLINYGHKYKKFPMDYLYLLKQKVEIMENSIKQDNNQRDLFYQLNLEIQEFIEQEEPLIQGQALNIQDDQIQQITESLNKIIIEFQVNSKQILELISKIELSQFSIRDQNPIVKVCEVLLQMADKSIYQLEIIEIIKLLVQEQQIANDQKNYLDVYICYIIGDYNKALQVLREDENEEIQNTPKYLVLQGLVYRFILDQQSLSFFDKAIEIEPQELNAIIEKGIHLTYKNQYKSAINEFEKCLKINNKIADVYFFKGNLYLQLGICHFWLQEKEEYVNALRMFELGLLLQPNFKFAELLKYYSLQKLKRREQYLILLQNLSKFHENYDNYMIHYAISLGLKLGKLVNNIFLKQNFTQQHGMRNIRKLLLIISFYKIDCLIPQQLKSIQNRISEQDNINLQTQKTLPQMEQWSYAGVLQTNLYGNQIQNSTTTNTFFEENMKQILLIYIDKINFLLIFEIKYCLLSFYLCQCFLHRYIKINTQNIQL
ncbi:hypothetical protein pb186bvf_002113 [Paramecium bursaria]